MSFVVALAVAAMSGFIALSYEILWYRAYAFVSRAEPGTFGLLLGAYLLGVALGALGSRWFCRDEKSDGDAHQLKPIALFVYFANVASFLVVPLLAWMATRHPWEMSLPIVAVAAGLLGAVLPLVSHFGIAPDDRAGAKLSYLYLANILGSASGSLITGFVILDFLGTKQAAILLALLGVALAFALSMAAFRSSRGRITSVLLAVVATVLVVFGSRPLFDKLYEKLLFKRHYTADKELESLVENRHGVIAVNDGMVYGGGAYDGIFNTGLRHDPNWVFRAYAIGAVHAAPRDVLMVGLASGSWAQIVANSKGVEKLTIIEINPGYLQLIAERPEVRSLLQNPKVNIVIDDGRRFLLRNPDRKFDVVVMNTTWHWRAHATNLLSEEFFRTVKAHLLPGGIFHFNTTMSYDAMKTSLAVFSHGLRMYNFMTVSDSPLVFDLPRWKTIISDFRIDGELVLDPADEDDRARITQLMAITSSMNEPPRPEGFEDGDKLRARVADKHVITDDNMWPEWWGEPEEE